MLERLDDALWLYLANHLTIASTTAIIIALTVGACLFEGGGL